MDHFPYADLFTSVPGIVVAVLGTISTVVVAIFGKFGSFKLPYESAPGLSRGFFNFILFLPFVVCFIFISPENARVFVVAALLGIPLAWVAYFYYGKAFANHRYVRPRLAGWFRKKVQDEVIVGGTTLTPAAQQKAHQGETLQAMLASAEYKPDEIWVRGSRTAIQLRIETCYYLFFFFAIVSVVAGALSLQTLITRVSPLEAATRVWDASHPAPPSSTSAPPA
jgi:hypothetical protein